MQLRLKEIIKRLPGLGPLATWAVTRFRPRKAFTTSASYWEDRYRKGGDSGSGSYRGLAEFKGEVINQFVREHAVGSVIEFGCGDGNQLGYCNFSRYLGLDVSRTAVERCRKRYRDDTTKSFGELKDYRAEKADLAMSLDVIFHLVEDVVYEQYMQQLFAAARKYVVIYSSNETAEYQFPASHFRHRKFSDWVEANAQDFSLIAHVPNKYPYNGDETTTSVSDFYFYARN